MDACERFFSTATQVGGLGLVSEALSVLNGAHLNSGGGRLGNLLRRYHHTLAVARDSAKTSDSDIHVCLLLASTNSYVHNFTVCILYTAVW